MTDGGPVWLVRLVLRLYPARFRKRYAADMEQQFSDSWQDRSGVLSRLRLLSGALVSLTVSAFAERRRSSLDGSIMRVARRGGNEPRGGGIVFGLLQDTQYALRLLRRQPGFSLFVMLTMAVGIGANVAVFSVVDGVLLKPLPFAQSDRLVAIWGRFDPESGFTFPQFPLSNPEFVDYRQEAHALEDVAAWSRQSVTVGGPGAEPERVVAASVSANLFSLLRVSPSAGRTFTDEEDRPKAPPVAVLSAGYWRSHFAGDPTVVGRTVLMNGVPTTIVGIMPEGFAFPGTTTRIWIPAGDRPCESGQPSGAQYPSDRQAGTRCVDRDCSRGAPDDHVGVEGQVSGDPHGPLPVRASDARGSVGIDPAGAGRAAGRNRLRAADRLRERREPDAGARRVANARDGHSRRAWRTAGTSVATDTSRERNPRNCWWRARPCACRHRRPVLVDARSCRHSPRVGSGSRRAHARVHAARHAGLGDAVGPRAGRARRITRAARHASRHEPDGDHRCWSPAHSAIARHSRSCLVCRARPRGGADAAQLRAAVVRRSGIPAVERHDGGRLVAGQGLCQSGPCRSVLLRLDDAASIGSGHTCRLGGERRPLVVRRRRVGFRGRRPAAAASWTDGLECSGDGCPGRLLRDAWHSPRARTILHGARR